MIKRLLGWLLYIANSNPHWRYRDEFYNHVKDSILRRFAAEVGWDQQHIKHDCWACGGTGDEGEHSSGLGGCFKCNGSGVYSHLWVLLKVYNLGGYEFHKPVDRAKSGEFYRYPTGIFDPIRNKIEGKIQHKPHMYARHAFWILYITTCPKRYAKLAWRQTRLKIQCRVRDLRLRFGLIDDDIPF